MAFVIGLPAVTVLSLIPQEALPPTETWDKLNHAVAYGALALAGGHGFRGLRSLLLVGIGLSILGAGLEIAQTALPDRTASVYDGLANLLGIALGAAVVIANHARAQRPARPVA